MAIFLIDPSLAGTMALEQALAGLEQRVQGWASDPQAYAALLQQVFGADASTEAAVSLRASLLTSGLLLPLRATALAGLAGAYAPAQAGQGEQVFLDAAWLATAGADQLEAVLLEELGHAIDQRLNGSADTPGDEGEIFSALLRGLTPAARAFTENDQHWITINGALRLVEAADTTAPTVALNGAVIPAFAGSSIGFGLPDVGFSASPTFADIDADGDLDAFIGNTAGSTLFFLNTGSTTNPSFTPGSVGSGLPDVGTSSSPTFVDIDADGDLDAFIGNNAGSILFFQNTGSSTAAAFAGSSIGFGLPDVGYLASPTFADIDADGDLDAFIGNQAGSILFFRNTGSSTAAAFAASATGFGLPDVGNSASPTLADFDADGDLDAFIGNSVGSTLFFLNTGSATSPAFATSSIGFGFPDVGSNASPTFADIDADGDLDAFIGNFAGSSLFFRNMGGGILSTTANGVYAAGSSITILVPFSEAVVVNTTGGIPTLLLETGSSDRNAVYASGSGTNTLSFSYTVQPGDVSADLDVASSTALQLNGASIADVAGNIANLILPAPGTAGSLAANAALVIDAVPPSITGVTSATANGVYAAGSSITILVPFSEAVVVNTTGGIPTLLLETGSSDRNAVYASGSGTNTLSFSYTVQPGDVSADLDVASSTALQLNGASIADVAGNIANLILPAPGTAGSLAANAALVIDAVPPSITGITVVGTQLQLQFSEPIVTTGLTAARFTATVAGVARSVASLATVAGDATRLTLTLSGTAPTSSQTLALLYTDLTPTNDLTGVVQDASGNDLDNILAPGRNVDTFASSVSVTSLASSYSNLLLTGTGTPPATAATTATTGTGNAGNNRLSVNQATAVANVLTGGGGIDTMDAGNGSDIYVIASSSDHPAAEISDSGTGASDSDELRFSSITPGETLMVFAGDIGLEKVTIGTGVAAAAVTTASTVLHINAAAAPNALILTGNAGANSLIGSAAADTLTGGGGADSLDGGNGSDVYLIAAATDHPTTEVISDSGLSGLDELRFTATTAGQILTLNAADSGLETVTISGTAALHVNAAAAPNGLALIGNTGANSLIGGAAADTLNGAAGIDTLNGGESSDLYLITSSTDHTAAEIKDAGLTGIDELRFTSTTAGQILTVFAGDTGLELVTLAGSTALGLNAAAAPNALRISGNSANNTITGSAATDTINGGEGADLYLVNSSTDHSAAEFADSGTSGIDELRFASATAGQILTVFAGDTGLETITIGTGTAAAPVITATTALHVNAGAAANGLTIAGNNGTNTLTGTAFSDSLIGNGGNDTLIGGLGNDTLSGGLGNDTLTGGEGSDSFRFDSALSATNVDRITDFNGIQNDLIELENAVFAALPTTGTLAATAFAIGTAATTTAHRILYNSGTGSLLYDPDGTGLTAVTAFATLTPGLALTSARFMIT